VLSKLDTIEVPCLIIVGKQDQLTPVKYSEFSHNKIKNSELLIINKAGHMVMLEKPNEVNQAIESFISNNF
jgi:pimeloyl-ACP methyl ester carboxylesterase